MVEIKATHKYPIPLGRTGENEAARIAFTLSPFEEVFPGGTPALLVKRKGDAAAYPVTLTVEGLTAYWTVTSADTDKAGFGQCELQWYLGNTLAKSNKFDFIVIPALEAGAEPPDAPSKRWFDAIQAQIGNLADLTTEEKKNLVAAINEAARSGGGGGGGAQADWSQNDAQAADFVKNRPGAYMTDPVATEIYNGILPEMASIQMDYVPTLGDVVTVKVGTESIDCTVGDFDGIPYFATVPIEDIAGGTATNYVFCAYQAPQWFVQTGGPYTGQNAVFEGTIRKVVKIPEKFLELENVKDVYWIKFEFDQKTKTYFSKNLDGSYAEYADIKAAIDNGKLVAAVASVFGEANNVGLVDGYWKYVDGMSVSFYEVEDSSVANALIGLARFRWKSGHIWEKIDGSIEFSYDKPMPSTLNGEQGTSSRVARSDHSHPDRASIQFLGKLTDGDEKTVACGNVSPDTPFVASGLDIPIGAEITLGFDDYTPATPVTIVWGGAETVNFSGGGNYWQVNLAYNACTDAYMLTTTRALTNLTLTYKTVPAQTKDYQKYVLAPYTVAPHLLLAAPNGLHKLTVDDNGNVLVDGESGGTGKDGKDGITPTIGENGNWYLGDEDTGKPSRGATGPQGTPGKTPDIKIGTVTTLPAGSEATASMGGTAAQPTLNLGIPKGANGDNANVTKDAVVGALGFTPISADDVPVKSVNGQTGAVKSTFYVTVTPTGSGYAATADKTAVEVYEAYAAGYAVYAVVKFASVAAPFELPLVAAAPVSGTFMLGFGALGSLNPTANPQYPTVSYTGMAWMAWLGTLARNEDIPAIPTALKNPNALNIKIGNTTMSYDGSAAKTVEIPEGGGTDESLGITGAATGEFPKVSAVNENGAPTSWETVEGEEVMLGGDVPAPTDAQVSSAVNTWLADHPEATTTVQDGAVTVKKLGYGKHIYGSKPYFCNSVGSGAVSYGSIGVVVTCKAGDTIYCNFNMSPNGAYQKPQLLATLPENQYGAIAPIGTIEKDDTTKAYTVPASATTAKAMYLPQNFVGIPAANNGSVEDALAWINKTMGTDGKWCAQNVPFEDYDAWYQTAQAELFDIDESCNKLMYASLYQAVSKLVGAKVAVLGDSLTEQSACSFITSAYNDRWMENVLRDTALTGDDGKTYKGSGWFALIARKYKIKWWCAGHGAQWWYSTTARPNGATAMVRKLIDGTDEFDYIVLEYGTNDILSGYPHIGTAADEASETATTSCGAIKWCIEQLQTRFPEASIVVILPNIHSGANGEAPATQQAYLDAVVPILKQYGVRRVNMAEDSGIVKSMMSTDGVHLRWPVVSNNVTHYTNDTPAVRKFSKCLESVLLQA